MDGSLTNCLHRFFFLEKKKSSGCAGRVMYTYVELHFLSASDVEQSRVSLRDGTV